MSKNSNVSVSSPADGVSKFSVGPWESLSRFLILGTEGGSYYATQKAMTIDNMKSALDCIERDGVKTVNTVVEISTSGRSIKNDACIAVLALAIAKGDEATRKAATDAVTKVCRTGTHMYQFAENMAHFRGWGRSARRAVSRFFTDRKVDNLAMQVIKYQSRNVSEGDNARWSAKDLLILSHPKLNELDADAAKRSALYDYIMNRGTEARGDKPSVLSVARQKNPKIMSAAEASKVLPILEAFEALKSETKVAKVIAAINKHKLPRECIPTKFHQDPSVQEALLDNGIGATALIRNLGNMSASGLIKSGSNAASKVIAKLSDMDYLKSGRIHPIQVLIAMKQYAAGGGMRSSKTWDVNSDIVDALDDSFYASFGIIEPIGKKTLLALDVSGSMTLGSCGGVPNFSPRDASAAMALITKATEKQNAIVHGFSSSFVKLDISPKQRLDDVIKTVSGLPFAGTDCSLPMKFAMQNKLDIEAFVIYTDSETGRGTGPSAELRKYREQTGIDAKLVVVGMVANSFSIADPNDSGMMDVVGFDSGAPNVISSFIRE